MLGLTFCSASHTEALSAAQSPEKLITPDIKFVRIQWIDFINTTRVRVLPVSAFRKLYENPNTRSGISVPALTLGVVGISVAEGFSPVGEWLYVPDLSTWRVCTYAPGHAVVMGWFQDKTPAPGKGPELPLCPRTILHRLLR